MGGAHAQVMSAAELSIGARVEQQTPADIRSALAPSGLLVKTYGPRGTVHLLPRDELPLWCAALGAAPIGSSLPATARIDANQTAAILDAIAGALSSGSSLDTEELDAAVIGQLGAWAGEQVVPAFGGWWPRWRQAISLAANRGILSFGENRGSRVTFVSPGVTPEADSSRALGWLLRLYLATYGPATAANFGRWLGVRPAWASAQFSRFAPDLEAVTVDGEPAFVNRGDVEQSETPSRGITLLPHFDPYVIGSFPRDRLFPGAVAARAVARGQAGVRPVLLVDGVVAGVWGLKRHANRLAVTVEAVTTLSKRQVGGTEVEVERLGRFLGMNAELTLGAISTGAHK